MVIFDCDGVLVDSELIANRLLCEALNELGLDYTLEQTIDAFMGRRSNECVREIEARLNQPVPSRFWTSLQASTWEAFDRELEPVPGVEDVIKSLNQDYCVASSGSREKTHKTLTVTGLLPWFENRIFSATEVEHGKPHPDLFLHAATSMGYRPEQCAVIEDSEPGVLAGLAAGMQVFGFCRTTPNEKLGKPGVLTFTDMNQLTKLLHPSQDLDDANG